LLSVVATIISNIVAKILTVRRLLAAILWQSDGVDWVPLLLYFITWNLWREF